MAIGGVSPNRTTVVKKEKVTILNLQGLRLVGELDDAGSRDLCILSHGFRASKEDPTLISVSKALTGAGFSTYRFDFTGNGESDGEFAYGSYWREADDIRSVVNYWRFRGWRIISLIGHSKGGNAVLLYASKYGDVASIVNMCGRFDLTRGMPLLGFPTCLRMLFSFAEIFEVALDLRFQQRFTCFLFVCRQASRDDSMERRECRN